MAVNRIYCATGLTGGTTGDLDTIDGADLSDKDMAIVCNQTSFYFYVLDADKGSSESSPDIITPDDNPGTKCWVLQSLYCNDITIADDIILATDDVKVGDTLEVVGSTQFGDADGTGADVTFYTDTAGDHIVFDHSAKTLTLTDVNLVMAAGGAINAGDNNITNVGDIALDSISADDGSSFSISSDWTNAGNTVADLGTITTIDINGGSIDGVTIGANSAGAINATNIDASGYITFDSGTQVAAWSGADTTGITGTAGTTNYPVTFNADGDLIEATSMDFNNINMTNVDIDSGAIDGVTLGGASAPTITDATVTQLSMADTGQIDWDDGTPASDETAQGMTIEATVDENTVGVGGCLVLSSDGNWDDADNTASATIGQLALAVDSGTGANKTLLLWGFLTETSWSWTPGQQLYVAENGALTATLPADSGDYVQVVGYALTATTVFFNPSPDFVEVA